MKKILLIVAVALLIESCSEKNPHQRALGDLTAVECDSIASSGCTQGYAPATLDSMVPEGAVGTMGKVVAAHFADLSFETALPIEKVLVRNGQRVRLGQSLAILDTYTLRNAVEQQQQAVKQAQLQIEQAHLQMQDVIISQGYDPEAAVPPEVMHNAEVKSGYALAQNRLATARTQLAAAQHKLGSAQLAAPFDGVVANIAVQPHQLAQPGQTVCRVIASDDMEVEFRVMEADLGKYKTGTAVSIIPVADKNNRYDATVNVINPIVDSQGTVTLRAKLSKVQGLFDGMNVEVILK